MKKILLLFLLALSLNVNAQLTSLTIDNQTPGWLSSKINYGDQKTLENIKITGYIDGSDLQFINNLSVNYSLRGVVDLSDCSIVKGGNTKPFIVDIEHEFPYGCFEKAIFRKFIFPRNCTQKNYIGLKAVNVDSIIVTNNTQKSVYLQNAGGSKYIFVPEGVEYIKSTANQQKIDLPSTVKRINSGYRNATIYSHIKDGASVCILDSVGGSTSTGGSWLEIYETIKECKIYVPKGTLESYLHSDWKSAKNEILEIYDVSDVQIEKRSQTFYKGDTYTLELKIFPDAELTSGVKWESINPEIVSVNHVGTIQCHSIGTTKITATPIVFYPELETKTDTIEITVCEHVTGIESDDIFLHINETKQIQSRALPIGVTDNLIKWTSNNRSVATIDENGLVTGLKQGSCVVTATSVDGGFTTECTVTVMQEVTNVNLYKHELDLKVGQSETLRVDVLPTNADDKSLTWKSENDTIAIVDERGKITGLKSGKVKIYAISNDNDKIMDYCDVSVTQPVSGLKLNYSKYEIKGIGNTVKLEAIVIPNDATNQEVRWVSSNDAVCMVSAGNVVATGLGTAVVIATTIDGGYMATCTINVVQAPQYPVGDVNGDGIADINDANIIINILLGKDNAEKYDGRAFVTGKDVVDISDANAIINIILGK